MDVNMAALYSNSLGVPVNLKYDGTTYAVNLTTRFKVRKFSCRIVCERYHQAMVANLLWCTWVL